MFVKTYKLFCMSLIFDQYYRSLLLAACEKKSILMFDPLCRKLIHAIDNAHNDCVNCVRFVKFLRASYLGFLLA